MTLKLNPQFFRVELHVHLDGSVRPETLFELSKKKNVNIPVNTADELRDFFIVKEPTDLKGFLSNFSFILDAIRNDKEALERICNEFVEDCADNKICYVEVRLAPHILAGDQFLIDEVMQTLCNTLKQAGERYKVVVRILLTAIRELEWTNEGLVELAIKYKDQGVVGIDLAGSEEHSVEMKGTHEKLVRLFKKAKEKGIHRVVHAGENGPAASVKEAIEQMYAERIGHGYHSIDDKSVYDEVKQKNLHLECCPRSSYVTGSVLPDLSKHPLKNFAKDKINFGLNRDDPLLVGLTLEQEYDYCKKYIGLEDSDIRQANINAANSCFLEDNEKSQLLQHVKTYFK